MKRKKVKSLRELARQGDKRNPWVEKLELEYVNTLKPKNLLKYRQSREEEVFIDNL
jgi:hypothetical protein